MVDIVRVEVKSKNETFDVCGKKKSFLYSDDAGFATTMDQV